VVPAAAGPVRVGVLNCYEDLSGGAGRSVWAAARPQLLVNVTNDAWFAGTSAPALHARLAAMRAIELRTDLVRAVNDGGGEWVDAAGRVRRLARGGAGVRIATPALRAAAAPATPYARLGDWPLAAALALLALGFRIRAGCSRACASAPARAWSAASRAR
jgi:apolipoprotein N-acyltransferase